MITLIATLKVKEGKMDEAKDLLKKLSAHVKNTEPGCLEYMPHTVKGQDNTIIFYEKYRDKEALKLHSENLPANFRDISPLLEPGMDVKTLFEIE